MSPEPAQLSHMPMCPSGRAGSDHVLPDFLYFINSFSYQRFALLESFCVFLPAPSHLGHISQLCFSFCGNFHSVTESILLYKIFLL